MTYRAKPVVKRTHRPSWESQDRRNFYTNLGFGLVVVIAVVILAAAGIATWYDQHLAPVASVDGQTITKDDFNRRFEVEAFRLTQARSRIQTELAAGRLTEEQAQAQTQFIQQREQQVGTIVLERLIDAKVTSVLAAQEGVTITDADIDAQLTKEATLPEQRHAWMIEVEPKVDEGKDEPTAEAKAKAKEIADKALADLNGGKAWEDVAKAVSTASTAPIGGDLGWVSKDFNLDSKYLDAIFALKEAGRTAVVEGEDGVYRIGRVTDIVPEALDHVYQDNLAKLDQPNYRSAVKVDLTLERLEKKITDAALAPAPQRRVAEIFIQAPDQEPLEGAVKTRHILYAPNDDPQKASEVKADDPAWAKAEADAKAAYDKIKADPKLFDEIARKESDEPGADTTGGKLPYFDPTQAEEGGGLDPDFGAAIFKEGLKAGDLLPPVKSAFGWHVIQVMYFPPDLDQAKKLKTQLDGGASFAQLAKDFSEGFEAKDGGELGWVARYQLPKESEDAIFATAVGKISEPLEIDGDGIHLFKVLEEKTRAPDGDQKDTIEQTAFSNWYEAKRTEFDIKREVDFSAGAG
ncbi:MAG TPA: peptidylprolyl isomerase [Candidatus Limnocylindrales bacterium]|jgi:parvulin-like peptidyl-prolyl isomerase